MMSIGALLDWLFRLTRFPNPSRDWLEHYDVDGVSYTPYGVIVSSDATPLPLLE